MEISPLILSYLAENGTAPVQNFGTFSLKKIGASYSRESETLLPPAKQVQFSPDFSIDGAALASFISEKNSTTLSEAESHVANQTAFWRNKLAAAEPFEIAGLGKFSFSDNEMHFSGEKIFSENPDFYGLEEIKIPNLKKTRKNSNFFWPTVLSLLIIGGIAAFSILNPEVLFGSKSFEKKLAPAQIITKKKEDSLANTAPAKDSTKIKDSTAAAAKPVSYKKLKLYKKTSWRKAKKHRTH